MRLAFSNIAWLAADDDEVLGSLGPWGFAGLEVAPTRLWSEPLDTTAAERRELRRQVEARGLRVVAMQSLLFGRPELQLFAGDAERRAMERHLLGMLDLGVALGADRLVFGSPGNRRRGDMEPDRAWDLAVDFFRRVGGAAADAGACFCIEANPPQYGCDFLVDASESTAFVRAVDSPGVRLHLDAACMLLAGDDAVERVRAGADVLAHVHVSAPELGPVDGSGAVDHTALSAALRAVDYGGSVSVEMRAVEPAVPQVAASAAYVREVYG